MKPKSRKKKPTLEDLVVLADAAGMRVSVSLVAHHPHCMVCGCPVVAKSDFTRATGMGVCKKKECREVLVKAGIV